MKTLTYVTLVMAVILTVLKITNIITWSWWWVTVPIWMPFLLALIAVAGTFWAIKKYGRR